MSVWPASTEFDMLERSWKIQTSKIKTSKIKTIKIKMWAGPGEEQLTMLKPAVNLHYLTKHSRLFTEWKQGSKYYFLALPKVMSHSSSQLCSEVPAPLMTDGRQDAAESGQEDSFGLGTETGGLGTPWSEGMRDLLHSIRHLLQLIR